MIRSVKIKGLKLKAITSVVADIKIDNNLETNELSKSEIDRICKMTGVNSRYVASEKITSLDLMETSVKKLLKIANFSTEKIDCIICITQTPIYNIPGSAYVLSNKLGLNSDVIALDINIGCPGFTHGLITIGKILDDHNIKNGVLVLGDTLSRLVTDKKDKLIYGDGAAACLVGFDKECKDTFASWISDYEKYDKAISNNCNINGNSKDLFMDGEELFTFAIRQVPQIISHNLINNNAKIEDIDLFFFHQTNELMLKYISKKMSIPEHKVPITVNNVGSTSSASIPIAMCRYAKANNITKFTGKLCFTGFGSGLSSSTIILDVADMIIDQLELV